MRTTSSLNPSRGVVTPARRVIGERIRARRTARGLTHDEVARVSGIHPTTLCLVEQGLQTPRVEQLLALGVAFGVSVADLLGPVGSAKNGARAALLRGKRRAA